MTELVIRERKEKITLWEMLTTAMGAFLGHNAETIKKTLRPLRAALAGEVFQTEYNADTLLRQLRERLEAVKTENRRLDRLSQMSAG